MEIKEYALILKQENEENAKTKVKMEDEQKQLK